MVERMYAGPIRHYTSILLDRVAPLFDDAEGEQRRATDDLLSRWAAHEDSYDQAVEAAYEHGQEHVLQFLELRSVFLTTGVAGLFHLFERQLYRQLNHELRDSLSKPIGSWTDAAAAITALKCHNGDGANALHVAFEDPDLRELRLVANTVKHGPGRSMDELKAAGARVVHPARVSDDWTVGDFSVLGVAIVVEPDDVRRYEAAILRFWALEGTFWADLG